MRYVFAAGREQNLFVLAEADHNKMEARVAYFKVTVL